MEIQNYVAEYTATPLDQNEIIPAYEMAVLKDFEATKFQYIVYILGHTPHHRGAIIEEFEPCFVGLSPLSQKFEEIKNQLLLYKNDFNINCISCIPAKSHRDAYLLVTELFHKYESQLYNDHHPERPLDIGWRCKDKACKYKPTLPIRVIIDSCP